MREQVLSLQAWFIHVRDGQAKPANKNWSVELQERGRDKSIFKLDSSVLSPCRDYRFGPAYTATNINLKLTKNYKLITCNRGFETRSSPCKLDSFMCATVKPSLQIKIQVLNFKREGEINKYSNLIQVIQICFKCSISLCRDYLFLVVLIENTLRTLGDIVSRSIVGWNLFGTICLPRYARRISSTALVLKWSYYLASNLARMELLLL